MNFSVIHKLYRSRREQQQLIVSGVRVWVSLDAKITRSAPTITKPTTLASPFGSTTTDPVAKVASEVAVSLPRVALATPVNPVVRPTVQARHLAAEPRQRLVRPQRQPEHEFSDNVRNPRRTFKDIVGMADTKQRLLRAAHDILTNDGGNDEPRNGILLFGEPGNGKTLFAEALAGELAIQFLPISFGDTASKWINETPEKIRAVFDTARQIGPCVLLIDEIDSFLKPRDGGAHMHSMDRDIVNTMLTEIVNLRGSMVILVAATNFMGQLDTAGIREGASISRSKFRRPI
jgi:transitional endoplasmic reticulum ATPase